MKYLFFIISASVTHLYGMRHVPVSEKKIRAVCCTSPGAELGLSPWEFKKLNAAQRAMAYTLTNSENRLRSISKK